MWQPESAPWEWRSRRCAASHPPRLPAARAASPCPCATARVRWKHDKPPPVCVQQNTGVGVGVGGRNARNRVSMHVSAVMATPAQHSSASPAAGLHNTHRRQVGRSTVRPGERAARCTSRAGRSMCSSRCSSLPSTTCSIGKAWLWCFSRMLQRGGQDAAVAQLWLPWVH